MLSLIDRYWEVIPKYNNIIFYHSTLARGGNNKIIIIMRVQEHKNDLLKFGVRRRTTHNQRILFLSYKSSQRMMFTIMELLYI